MRACLAWGAIVMGVMALLVGGCGGDGGFDRWDGDGCQPACVHQTADGTPALSCVTPGNDIEKCQDMDMGNVACEGDGVPTCDTEDGLPRCLDSMTERPVCTR